MTSAKQELLPKGELSELFSELLSEELPESVKAKLTALKAKVDVPAAIKAESQAVDLTKFKRNTEERFGNLELGKVPNPKWDKVNPKTRWVDGDTFYFRCRSFVDIETGKVLTERRQQRIKIAKKDDSLFKAVGKSKALDDLADELRKKIQRWEAAAIDGDEGEAIPPTGDMLVSEFYEDVFIPDWKALVKAGKRAAVTFATYQNYWDGWLSKHFNGSKNLKSYQAYMGRHFLENLRKKNGEIYRENTLRKIHSIAQGIFEHAVEKNFLEHNVWKDIKWSKIPSVSTEQGLAYTEAQVEAMIQNLENDLSGHTNGEGLTDYSIRAAQVALALGFWAGLRPSEMIALKWENVDIAAGTIKVCESIVNGVHADRTKTDVDRVVRYLSPLAPILRRWKLESGDPKDGFVLKGHQTHKNKGAIHLKNLSDRIIYPNCEKNGLGDLWKGTAFYGLRRGCGTLLAETGSTAEEGSQFLGNNIEVFQAHYLADRGRTVIGARATNNYELHKQRKAAEEVERQEQQVTESRNELAGLGLVQ